jgi:hypothetical protein
MRRGLFAGNKTEVTMMPNWQNLFSFRLKLTWIHFAVCVIECLHVDRRRFARDLPLTTRDRQIDQHSMPFSLSLNFTFCSPKKMFSKFLNFFEFFEKLFFVLEFLLF